jgi:hypothetical protein
MTTTTAVTDIAVMPIRFTDQVPQMRDFLALLGFSPRVSRAESWVDMAGGAGMVAVHGAAVSDSGARPGDTGLTFEAGDVAVLAARLTAAGFPDAEVYDEAYGRALRVRDKGGAVFIFGERPDDLYGYHADDPRPEHGIVSMPLQFDPPVGPFADLLAAAGFDRLDEGDDEWWRVWSSPAGGLIALHPSVDDRGPGSVQLGFRTGEPLADLATRLIAAGHSDVAMTDEFGGELTVIDPDGQKVLVQAIPGARSPDVG